MPTPAQILSDLGTIANSWKWLAIVWHVYVAVLVLLLVFRVRPTRRLMGTLVCLPLFSASAMAWLGGVPFNGLVLGVIAIVLLVTALRFRGVSLHGGPVAVTPRRAWIPGAVMIAFGWVYPHFLEGCSFGTYLYAAPVGLVPCPTLSVIVGFSLILGAFRSCAWTFVAGLTGLFYGIFGAVRLGVPLDWVLAVGSVVMIVLCLPRRSGDESAP